MHINIDNYREIRVLSIRDNKGQYCMYETPSKAYNAWTKRYRNIVTIFKCNICTLVLYFMYTTYTY